MNAARFSRSGGGRAMGGKAHLAEALRWDRGTEVERAEILALGLGMAGPAALGAALGHLPLGLMAAFGGLAAGGVGMAGSARAQLRALGEALWPVALAAILAACAAGHGWLTDAGLVLLAGAAAILGGYSRPMAVATARFIPFLIILVHLAEGTTHRAGFLLLVAAGGAWTGLLSLGLGALLRTHPQAEPAEEGAAAAAPTAAQKFRRWKRSLTGLAGWQYPLRLTLCLGVAGILRWLWTDHHMHWVALTVALLSQRQIEALPVKVTQRAFGTALGVAAGGLFILYRPSDWALVLGVGLLAAARPLLKARNYLAYSAIMTPLIILVMDAGQPLDLGVLGDRLLATLLGAGLVIAANLAFGAASQPA